MKYVVFDEKDKCLGSVTTNRSLTDEEICDLCEIRLVHTQDEREHAPENGMYDLKTLTIVRQNC